MRILPNLPLRHRLTLISLATTLAALVLAGTGFIVYDQYAFKRSLTDDVAATAQMIGYNSASALPFNDPKSAAETLRGLELHPHIVFACVYDATGRVFATYPAGHDVPPLRGARQGEFEEFGPDRLDVQRDIVLAGEKVGTILLRSDLSERRERLRRHGSIIGVVSLLAMVAAYLLARHLQRAISGPVAELAAIAGRVRFDQDFSVRAVKNSNDELGRLIDGFNDMLGHIEARDAALRQARDRLEKRVEERTAQLAREQARFKVIFESVPVGISLYSRQADGSMVRLINDAHLRICGITREQSQEADLFRRLTHPDDYARQAEFQRQIDAGLIDRFALEKRYFRPDGTTATVAMSSQHQSFPDGSREVLTTIVDITELKRAEEAAASERAHFKFIFESVPVGISLVAVGDVKAHVVNPAHERITGVRAQDSDTPGIFARVTHPDDYRRQCELMQNFVRGDAAEYSVEKRYLHPGGREVWVVLTSRKFTDPATGWVKSVTTLVDITERKVAEARLAETHARLLDTSRRAGMAEVATSVLHNVGNVLNSVNVSATLVADQVRESKSAMVGKVAALVRENRSNLGAFLETDPRGQQLPAYLETLAGHLAGEQAGVLKEVESLRKNIEHIKNIVAMQQSYAKVSGVSETVGIVELVEDALQMNAGELLRHEVELVRDFQVRPMVTLEKHKVLQILVNLIGNAKHACEESGGTDKQITIRITISAGKLAIAVLDNGVGIAAENLKRIFGHGFTTRRDGHGFGLHSGALAARELGGELTVHSDGPGRGATFTLELPFPSTAFGP